jgi:PPOX class probable F420-dependent enzyme
VSVRLTAEEVDDFLAAAHTGVLTTLRRDGWPVSLPVWFVVVDGTVYVRTPARSRKVQRVRHDDRVSFVVEAGWRWDELKAVVITGRAALVDDDVTDAFDAKYRAYRAERSTLPEATKRHYRGNAAVLRIDPVGDPITWDNSKIRRVNEEMS